MKLLQERCIEQEAEQDEEEDEEEQNEEEDEERSFNASAADAHLPNFKKSKMPRCRKSPWARRYRNLIQNLTDSNYEARGKRNQFFNVKLAKAFLKKHVPYLPFFIKFFWGNKNAKKPPNNGYVERFHRQLKDMHRKLGGIGRIALRVHVERLANWQRDQIRLTTLRRYAASAKYKLQPTPKDDEIISSAQWKGRIVNRSLFFNKQMIIEACRRLFNLPIVSPPEKPAAKKRKTAKNK